MVLKGKNAAAYAAERLVSNCYGLYQIAMAFTTRNFFKTQNPQLIIESSFKSRAAYDGAGTVHRLMHCDYLGSDGLQETHI